ncbi:MAG: glycosyltransferase family 4 protein [Pseudomonadota bacterium]
MEGLISRGHEVILLTKFSPPAGFSSKIKTVNVVSGWRLLPQIARLVFRFPQRFLPGLVLGFHSTLQILKTECSVMQIIRQEQIEIIHTHFFSPGGENCVIASGANGIPVIATLRGAELRNYPEINYGSMRSSSFRHWFHCSKPSVSFFTAPNSELAGLLVKRYGIPVEKVARVPNGVSDLENLGKVTFSCRVRLKMIAIGWLTPLKNHQVILRALRYIASDKVSLTIVGEGYLEKTLRDNISDWGLRNVELSPNLEREKLMSKLSTADCLIHPSLVEGMPNVVLEALALGVPCIASDISAHRDLITENYDGFLFPAEDDSELSRVIESVANNRRKISALKPNCVRTAKAHSLEIKLDRYETIYRSELIGRSLSLPAQSRST